MAECEVCKIKAFAVQGLDSWLNKKHLEQPPVVLKLPHDMQPGQVEAINVGGVPGTASYFLRTPSWLTARPVGGLACRSVNGALRGYGVLEFSVDAPNEAKRPRADDRVEVVCAETGQVAAAFRVQHGGDPMAEDVADAEFATCEAARDYYKDQFERSQRIVGGAKNMPF